MGRSTNFSDGFNKPFQELKTIRFPEATQARPKTDPVNEDLLFLEEMKDVIPLCKAPQRLYFPPFKEPGHRPRDFEDESLSHLNRLVKGMERMDLTFCDGYIEGGVPNAGKQILKDLKSGRFSIQAYVDLHGMKREEALKELTSFIVRSYSLGLRCVLVVHGKGYNSKGSEPVLKELVPRWLTKAPMRRIVLAFCSARPYDGGTGALYVLLRRWRNR